MCVFQGSESFKDKEREHLSWAPEKITIGGSRRFKLVFAGASLQEILVSFCERFRKLWIWEDGSHCKLLGGIGRPKWVWPILHG